MRITQIRDDGRVNTLRTLKIEQLVEQMKVETKAQLVSGMREVLPYIFPGDKNDYVQKVPKLLPAAAFVRKNGVMTMDEYNGVVMLQVNNLSGPMEADEVKERVKEFPQTYLAFTGSSGKSVKIWVRFTYPNDRLPTTSEEAELFHAHAYRLAACEQWGSLTSSLLLENCRQAVFKKRLCSNKPKIRNYHPIHD